MRKLAVDGLSDPELVAHFRRWSVERAKVRALPEGNRIYDREMAPAYKALVERGDASRRSLLALVNDTNLDVRLDAAILVYDLDPQKCRKAMCDVLKEKSLRPLATIVLIQKDPAFAARFSRLAADQDDSAVERMIDEFTESRN